MVKKLYFNKNDEFVNLSYDSVSKEYNYMGFKWSIDNMKGTVVQRMGKANGWDGDDRILYACFIVLNNGTKLELDDVYSTFGNHYDEDYFYNIALHTQAKVDEFIESNK